MLDPKDVHIILIGCQRTEDYRHNLEIIRYNWLDYGKKVWITTVFNGDQNDCASGCGENTFIYLPENTGYGYGALDSFNSGLEFARSGYRPYVAIFNFDVWFLTEEGFVKAFNQLILSIIKSKDNTKLEKISLGQIKGTIETFSIKEEKFINEKSDNQRLRFSERQRQIELAEKRNEKHIGAKLD